MEQPMAAARQRASSIGTKRGSNRSMKWSGRWDLYQIVQPHKVKVRVAMAAVRNRTFWQLPGPTIRRRAANHVMPVRQPKHSTSRLRFRGGTLDSTLKITHREMQHYARYSGDFCGPATSTERWLSIKDSGCLLVGFTIDFNRCGVASPIPDIGEPSQPVKTRRQPR